MRTRALPLFFAASLVLSGCLGGEAGDNEPTTATADDRFLGEVDAPTRVRTAPAVTTSAPPAPTLDAPPTWATGTWFDVLLTDEFTGDSYQARRVVAGVEGDNYLVGMPRDGFSNEHMVLHVPGYGRVAMADLSFEIHDARFVPVRFPLTDGLSWETLFEGREVTATATVTSPTTADIEMIGPNDHITLTYDATVGAVTRFAKDGYGRYEVVAHGVGHEGVVTVPHMHDVIFQHGRFGGVVAFGNQPSAPLDTVEVDPTYDRVSFILLVGALPVADGVPNTLAYERVTAPDGEQFELMVTPTDPAGFKMTFHMKDKPAGAWTFEHVAGGAMLAMAEGIAYHVFDIVLPSGCILPSEGEHAHGDHAGGCTG